MSKNIKLYKTPVAMEPLSPIDSDGGLSKLASKIVASSGRLSGVINLITRDAIADFLRPMNSYYSNSIEGHDTHPIEIFKALGNDYSDDKKKRDLQKEALAHIKLYEVLQNDIKKSNFNTKVTSTDYIKGIHSKFYNFLPESFLKIKSTEGTDKLVIPGELRECEVKIGRHYGPFSEKLSLFMDRFESFYSFIDEDKPLIIKKIIGIAASHHRLVWIHPFVDGNGRVARLFSDSTFMINDLDSSGLWSISRGLSRRIDDYRTKLANADLKRINDYDGRGNLSNKYLEEFCSFFLEVTLDQIEYMYSVLDVESMIGRIASFTEFMVQRKRLRLESKYILTELFLRGKLSKIDALRITNTTDKTLKLTIDALEKMKLLVIKKEGVKIMYFVKYSLEYSPLLFPGLYPAIKEVEMINSINSSF